MPMALTITPALIVAAVLLVSGVAKLRTPDDEAGWTELGVPAALRRGWLMRLHPFAEIALALALALLGGVLGVLAAVAATLLFAVYLVMIWRARKQTPDASCACFGERKPITVRTLLRNGWLVLLSGLAAATIGVSPLLGGVVALALPNWSWLLALAAVAVTFVLVHQPAPSASSPDDTSVPAPTAADDLDDYIRTRTPAVPVQLGDGTTVNLRTLSARAPILILAVSETCGSCTPVIESAEHWRTLLPEVSVRLLLRATPEQSTLTSSVEPQTLHDPQGYVRDSIAEWPTPTAVLLGADGLLAGGPVSGHPDIQEFVADIYESLHGVRPPV
ncbi:MauE/DoxX family redox-associated membrane protein [Microbacterium sp.]|uniref:MauE/DoxX family redox-associated membrane protein n=1 Tax=Microbacterium sp. TaxID=51671 RepID=UPI00281110F9|nr:MauE/DoxX family redox-associated membrane protein [Microbacterium sp.]